MYFIYCYIFFFINLFLKNLKLSILFNYTLYFIKYITINTNFLNKLLLQI